MKYTISFILFWLVTLFFCGKIFYGLGIADQKNVPCSQSQCMKCQLKGEESCWKYKKK